MAIRPDFSIQSGDEVVLSEQAKSRHQVLFQKRLGRVVVVYEGQATVDFGGRALSLPSSLLRLSRREYRRSA